MRRSFAYHLLRNSDAQVHPRLSLSRRLLLKYGQNSLAIRHWPLQDEPVDLLEPQLVGVCGIVHTVLTARGVAHQHDPLRAPNLGTQILDQSTDFLDVVVEATVSPGRESAAESGFVDSEVGFTHNGISYLSDIWDTMRAVTKTAQKDKRVGLSAAGLILVGLGEAVGVGVVGWVVVDLYAIGHHRRRLEGRHGYCGDGDGFAFAGEKKRDEKVGDNPRSLDDVAL